MRKYLANGGYSHDDTRSFAARVFRSGVGAPERAAGQQPFALIVDTYEPHEPWTPPRHYIREYGDRGYRGPEPAMPRYKRVSKWLDNGNRDLVLGRLRALYAAEVTMTDRWLGVFLERLHELGLERDTVIVLVADHGIQLGEHGWTGKISVALHPVLIRVPFVIVDPPAPGGRGERLLRLATRPRTDAPVDGRRAHAGTHERRRPVALAERRQTAGTTLRLRRLRREPLSAHGSLGVHLRQPHAPPAALRPQARSR